MTTNDPITESCISFKIGEDLLAAGVNYIHDIVEVGMMTAIPHAPVFLKGMMTLRGTALPVVDSRLMFGLPATMVTDDTSILVIDMVVAGKKLRLGVMVDAVSEVIQIDVEDIMPLPSTGARYPLDFIRGTVKSGDAFLYLLDVVNVFATEELVAFQTTFACLESQK
jgi:purine-binding chemotaxis protein CheW